MKFVLGSEDIQSSFKKNRKVFLIVCKSQSLVLHIREKETMRRELGAFWRILGKS